MLGHQDVCLSMQFAGNAHGLFHGNTSCDGSVLEVFTDADWNASKMTRCSISSVAIFCRKYLLYSASRTQRVVALSESEIYSAASGMCGFRNVRWCLTMEDFVIDATTICVHATVS